MKMRPSWDQVGTKIDQKSKLNKNQQNIKIGQEFNFENENQEQKNGQVGAQNRPKSTPRAI